MEEDVEEAFFLSERWVVVVVDVVVSDCGCVDVVAVVALDGEEDDFVVCFAPLLVVVGVPPAD